MRILRPFHPVLFPRPYRRKPVQPKAPNRVVKLRKKQSAVRTVAVRIPAVPTVAVRIPAINSVVVRNQWPGNGPQMKS